MESFTVKTRLTSKEYSKVMFLGLYKKPAFILATIVGLYMLVTVLLDYFNIIFFYSEVPIFEIICGLLLLSFPTIIVLMSNVQFKSNPSYQSELTYTFSESGVAIEGLKFKGEYLWSHITKEKEIGGFLILYHNKKFGNCINKSKLTAEQLEFIKSKIKKN